jgi:hypothetical protein
VRSAGKNYQFSSNKRACLKCAIFVARVYCCYKHLMLSQINDRLMRKARACLSIMQDHISTTFSEKTSAKVSRSTPPSATVVGVSNSLSDQLPSEKRSRGRSKKSSQTSAPLSNIQDHTPVTTSDNKRVKVPKSVPTPPTVHSAPQPMSDQKTPGVKPKGRPPPKSSRTPAPQQASTKRKVDHHQDQTDVNMQAYHVPRKRRTSEIAAAPVGSCTPSMQLLISRFEEQYQEMGERYHEMGDILQQMKEAAASRRERTEGEIRADLLEEVQRNIMNSLPRI